MSPITPNEALSLLACLSPAVHHLGVVEHLTRVIRGNACCLTPSLCFDLMSRLTFPTLPSSLCKGGMESYLESAVSKRMQDDVALNTSLDASVRVTLAPLYETLVQCAMMHLRLQLEEAPMTCSPVRRDSASQLWNACSSCCMPEAASSSAASDGPSESAALQRGAALLLAFSAQTTYSPSFTECDRLQNLANSPFGISWQWPGFAGLICVVVRRLMVNGAADREAVSHHDYKALPQMLESSASLHNVYSMSTEECGAVHGALATSASRRWVLFCEAARRCLHWSILVCRATPMLPSRALRAFVVDSLVESLQALHTLLTAEPVKDPVTLRSKSSGLPAWPRLMRAACEETLSWLLTRCLPVISIVDEVAERSLVDDRKAVDLEAGSSVCQAAGRCRPLWTVALRDALLVLANDFTDVSVALLRECAPDALSDTETHAREQSLLVSRMISVAFRLSLQFAASAPRCTPAALSEMDVAHRVLQAVSSLNLQIACSSAAHTSEGANTDAADNARARASASVEQGSRGSCVVSLAEGTWCRLVCVQRLVQSSTSAFFLGRDNNRVLFLQDRNPSMHAAFDEQLVRMGVHHVCRSSTLTVTGPDEDKECTASRQEDAIKTIKQTGMAAGTSTPLFSLDFVLMLVRCWRAWLNSCPDASCIEWLDGVVGCDSLPAVKEDVSETPAAAPPQQSTGNEVGCGASKRDFSSLRQLSLRLVEAWATALYAEHDRSPLDVCACWSALAKPSLIHQDAEPAMHSSLRTASSAFHAMQETMLACEQRLSRQCSDYLLSLSNVRRDSIKSRMLQKCEVRPPLCRIREAARVRGEADDVHEHPNARWRPVCSPAFISHIGLRLLYSGTLRRAVLPFNSEGGDTQLPLPETAVEMLRRAIDSPLSVELMFFRLSMTSKYAEWCEASAMHTGWCSLNAEDCSRDVGGEDTSSAAAGAGFEGEVRRGTSAPWSLLTVEGLASSSGLHGQADTAALVYLWCLCDAAEAETPQRKPIVSAEMSQGGAVGSVSGACSVMSYDSSASAVSPLSFSGQAHTHSERPQLPACPLRFVQAGDKQPWLRQAVDQWSHRYALRLLLFLLQEESWQRRRIASATHQSSASPWRQSRTSHADPPSVMPERALQFNRSRSHTSGPCTGALPPAPTTTDHIDHPSWHSNAFQLLLCGAAQRLLHRVEQLTAEVYNSRRLWHPGMPCAMRDAPHEMTQLLHRLSGQAHAARAECSFASCVMAALASIRDDKLLPPATNTPHGHQIFLPWHSSWPPAQPPPDRVQELEAALLSLGLVAPNDANCFAAYETGVKGVLAAGLRDGEELDSALMAEEAHAVLTTLCTSPALTFLTSPRVLQFADSLWRRCWRWLTQFSQGAFTRQMAHHRLDRGAAMINRWHGAQTVDEAAEVDALVTCRVMLHATGHFHALAAELMQHLCQVFMPALKASANGSHFFVSTPTEALAHHLTLRDATRESNASFCASPSCSTTPAGGALDGRGALCFSPSSLRAYEVLCLGRFGKEERRGPCVWQRWMQELARGDAILQGQCFVQWKSRLAC
ncbi:hypothetical protein ABL78_3697 [Leptomonas seymouri]|uniref:Uncharacterized protein n=1 Tax=Leptomonas seymouri TaxID=5684 RepID=A0A0N0P6J2_LEPSE|nr:hypothetical protein ABL78_3697 [Leptomonas seymouri]|eukprot:KPI87227.1 hypothetical protein ABL78_3697 [Leptomonas seymouri]